MSVLRGFTIHVHAFLPIATKINTASFKVTLRTDWKAGVDQHLMLKLHIKQEQHTVVLILYMREYTCT